MGDRPFVIVRGDAGDERSQVRPMRRIGSERVPGWVVDPGTGCFTTVGCPVDPWHLRKERTHADVPFEEPPRPQRRLLDRADAVKVRGTAALLLRMSVIEAMRRAGLTGWSCGHPAARRGGARRYGRTEAPAARRLCNGCRRLPAGLGLPRLRAAPAGEGPAPDPRGRPPRSGPRGRAAPWQGNREAAGHLTCPKGLVVSGRRPISIGG